VKVWTGGNASGAGTLVHSQPVPTYEVNQWNTVYLTALIPIPTTGDLYYGYECNTTGGNPAGADSGPPIEGKGNMMYFGGAWTTLTQLAPELTYNWALRAFAQFAPPTALNDPAPINTTQEYFLDVNQLRSTRFDPSPQSRYISGYKVYRDGAYVATIDDAEIISYLDENLPNGTYLYGVTSLSPTDESVPATVEATVNFQLAPQFLADGFEDYDDFTNNISPWNLRDIDNAPTFGMTGVTFPGSGEPMSYIVFNPASTTPPLDDLQAHGGSKMLASFGATTMVSNNWLITPRMHLGTGSAIKFFAKSHTDVYGLERFRVGVSTLPSIIVQSFTYVSGADFVEAPINWTEYVYDLSAWDGQNVFVGIRCVSDDAFVFYVDDITLHSEGGYVSNEDILAPELKNALSGNYPNPFNPETTIRYSTAAGGRVNIDIYNVKGQLVRNLVCDDKAAGDHAVVYDGTDNNGRPLPSGVYFYRMKTGRYSSTRKMILMK